MTQAQRAYSPTQSPLRSVKSIEYQAFSDIIGRLKSATSSKDRNFAELAAALHDNRALWTILASDVADPGNGLPRQLRAQIFYLAEFTHHHSRKVLKGEADADALIDVNTAVLRGLGASIRSGSDQKEAG